MMNISPMNLADKRILVTGASSGIGKAAAQLISRLEAKIVLMARNEARLQMTLESLSGEGHSIYAFDLTAVDDIPAMMKKIVLEQGMLSGFFHAAGIEMIMPVSILKRKYIDPVFDVSIKAALMLARGFCQKGVQKPGNASLVFMSSAAGLCGVAGMSIYSASKAAIDGAVRSLACELAPRSIRVNSIVAGAVQTEMHDEILKKLTEEEILEYRRKHLLGFGKPEDIAHAAAFLLSDASHWITGTTMIVDGGYSCT